MLSFMISRDAKQSSESQLLSRDMKIVRISTVVSFLFLIIVLATLAGLYSPAAGICLILISLVPFFCILMHFDIVKIAITRSILKFLFLAYIVLAVLAGMSGTFPITSCENGDNYM